MVNPFDPAGKVAIVTGANTGIGQAIALALAATGADIAVVGRTPAADTIAKARAPFYIQLRQLLRDAIQKNVLEAGDAIPTERQLAAQYDVSRITVRKAISGLVEEAC